MKTNDENIFYAIALNLIKGIGPVMTHKLIGEFGSPKQIFHENPAHLKLMTRIGPVIANAITNRELLSHAEKELSFIEKHGITTLFFDDSDYPMRLRDCVDAPYLLFFKGNCDLNSQHLISMVGTRSSTPYGRDLIDQFTARLAELVPDAVIVSGLAYGIDIISHRAALRNQLQTIGVMAHGLDRIYPNAHRNTAKEMLSQGGILTEYISGTNPEKGNFIARNRIVAGISEATIIVETADKGGSIITANIANTYNRDVFAFPGRVCDQRSKGCNRLIRKNIAALITGADDFLELMNWLPQKIQQTVPQLPFIAELNNEEQLLFELLSHNGELQLNQIAIETGISVGLLTGILMEMELRNIVRCYPGAVYRLI